MDITKSLTDFKNFGKALVPVVLVLMIVASFTLSVFAYSRTVKIEQDVTVIQKQMISLQQDINKNLEAINAHVMLIEKYAVDNYNWFYGDIDLRKSKITVEPKSSVTTKKK